MSAGGLRISAGTRSALPVLALLLVGFAVPLLTVIGFSLMPARTFGLSHPPTLENYISIYESTTYISLLWSLGLAALTVVILILISYPVAYGLVRVFGRWSTLITLLFVIPLFVSENVRLYGWLLFFIKNGVLLGTLKSLFGVEWDSILFTKGIVLFGMVYVHIPYMLFPLTLGISMVPEETREAAFDLGATRWQVFREVELPLSLPGLIIGCLLTFVLAVGAIAEIKSPRRAGRHSDRSRYRDRLHLRTELAARGSALGAADADCRGACPAGTAPVRSRPVPREALKRCPAAPSASATR